MYKNIIPGLISLDTKLKKISGFMLNLSFFKGINKESRFHYKIVVDNDIVVPSDYDFRNGYYFKSGRNWFYERKIFWKFHLKFKYDVENKIFSFNRIYSLMPIELGGISPVGWHIANFISLDLFLDGLLFFTGCAIKIKNKNLCFIAPGFNGKTNFLIEAMRRGARYISDDLLIIDTSSFEVYPSSSSTGSPRLFSRPINKIRNRYIGAEETILEKQKIDKLFLVQNSMNSCYATIPKDIVDFLLLTSLIFLDNQFIRAYLFEEKKSEKIFDVIMNIRKIMNVGEFREIKKFDFKSIIEEYECK